MAGSDDLSVRGGVVVNRDGEGRRGIGVTACRVAAISHLEFEMANSYPMLVR